MKMGVGKRFLAGLANECRARLGAEDREEAGHFSLAGKFQLCKSFLGQKLFHFPMSKDLLCDLWLIFYIVRGVFLGRLVVKHETSDRFVLH